MTSIEPTATPSSWSWWEGRRLAYNTGLFVAGWLGFGVQALAFTLWSERAPDLAYVAL